MTFLPAALYFGNTTISVMGKITISGLIYILSVNVFSFFFLFSIDGPSYHKSPGKSILIVFISYDKSLGKVSSLQGGWSWPYQYRIQIPNLAPEIVQPTKEEVFHSKHSTKATWWADINTYTDKYNIVRGDENVPWLMVL